MTAPAAVPGVPAERLAQLRGNAGFRTCAANPYSGDVTSLYQAREAEISAQGAWVLVCEAHGAMVDFDTRRIATPFLSRAPLFCEECRTLQAAAIEAELDAPPATEPDIMATDDSVRTAHPDSTMPARDLALAYTDLLVELADTEPDALARAAARLQDGAERVSRGRMASPAATLAYSWLDFRHPAGRGGAPVQVIRRPIHGVTVEQARKAAAGVFTGTVGDLVAQDAATFTFAYTPAAELGPVPQPLDRVLVTPERGGAHVRVAALDADGKTITHTIASPAVPDARGG